MEIVHQQKHHLSSLSLNCEDNGDTDDDDDNHNE
jgi:hypothetical protein